MSKYFRTGSKLLISALIGFFGMLAILNTEISFDFSAYAYPANIIILAVGMVLLLFSIYCYVSIRNTMKQDFSGDEEDAAQVRMYKQYSDASLGSTLALLSSLAALSLGVITDQPVWMLLAGIALALFSFVMSLLLPGLMHSMYPERNLPSISDKNFADKLLQSSDDGEKHVMLDGLYKTYLTLNSLLLASMMLLLVYSMLSGTSQLFSIFTVAVILAVANTQYMFSIRNK